MFYLLVAVKLILGFLALVLVINLTGKGNLAPASASDQVQNYVLGGIVGGVIYNPDITILEFLLILVIWFALVLSLRWLKKHNGLVKRMVDGTAGAADFAWPAGCGSGAAGGHVGA